MNLIEAIKSGKRFRRPESMFWIDPLVGNCTFTTRDALSENWVLEIENFTMSEAQISNIFYEILQDLLELPGAPLSLLDDGMKIVKIHLHKISVYANK